MENLCEKFDIISCLAESGLAPVLEQLLISYIPVKTVLQMCKVCITWRSAVDIDYVWKTYCMHLDVENLFESWAKTSGACEEGGSDKTLEPLCVWGSYFRWRIRTRNFLTGSCSHHSLDHGIVNPEPGESFYCFDCSATYLAIGTTAGRVIVWNVENCTRVAELKWATETVGKVWVRGDNLVIQQGTVVYIALICEDHIDYVRCINVVSDSTDNSSDDGEDISVTCEFRDLAYCIRKEDHLVVLDLDNNRRRKKIFLPENHWVETLLLSHLCISKHLIFISSRRKEDRYAFAIFCEKCMGSILFQFCVTDMIDVHHPANMVFCDSGMFLEGRIRGNDYPALTLWKCWNIHGEEIFESQFSSDFGMMLTGSHSGQKSPYSSIITPENDTHLTASGHAYLSFFCMSRDLLAFSQREHSGVSINVYRTDGNTVQKAWRSRHYVETAAKRGGSIPISLKTDANILLAIGSNFQQLLGSDLSSGKKIWAIPLQTRATRLWVHNNIVVMLCGGGVERVKGFEVLKF